MKTIYFFIYLLTAILSAIPNIQTANLSGILTKCIQKRFSYVEAIRLLQNDTIQCIRTEFPNVKKYVYVPTLQGSLAPTPLPITEAEPIDSLDALDGLLPRFLLENFKKHSEYLHTILVPQTAVAKLVAFLFPMHNGECKANNLTSYFLGFPSGPNIIKNIINILIQDSINEHLIEEDTEAIVETSIGMITNFNSIKKSKRNNIKKDIREFLQALQEAIKEREDHKDIIIHILMCYLWEKSNNLKEAISGLNNYVSEKEIERIDPIEREEEQIILELRNADPARIFPPILDKTVLNFGAIQHADCAEVTVRNFLNCIFLNPDGSIKEEYRDFIQNHQFLLELYDLNNPKENLKNDQEKAYLWNRMLMKLKVARTEANDSTEMETGFDNFIFAVTKLLGIADQHHTSHLEKAASRSRDFYAICGTLSNPKNEISWRKERVGHQIVSIHQLDEIFIKIQTIDKRTHNKQIKRFKICQGAGHAYIKIKS